MTALATLLAYLCGSIPTGVLLARLAGVDVRSQGSGNIGATNVARTAGRTLGVLTLLGDALKGLVPVVAVRALGFDATAVALVAFAALAGHVFSIFLRFRGGKGVATGLGVLFALAPGAALMPLVVFVALFAATRIVSLASILATAAAPLAMLVLGYPTPFVAAACAMAGLIVARHHENIARLFAGTEPRFQSRTD